MSSLGKALADLDGILAGCEYLDIVDQCSRTAVNSPISTPSESDYHIRSPCRRHANLTSFFQERKHSLRSEPSSPRRSAEASTGELKPSDFQWAALRTLRDGIDFQFEQFEGLCMDGTSYANVASRVLESYGDAKGMRQAGILTFRDILQGLPAEELRLEDIMAFANLSYVLSKLLLVKGAIKEDQILKGLPVWREAVLENEREPFDFLARQLWPEANKILDDNTGLNLDTFLSSSSPDLDSMFAQDAAFISKQSSIHFPEDILGAGLAMPSQVPISLVPEWNVDGLPISLSQSYPAFQGQTQQLMSNVHDTFDFSIFQNLNVQPSPYTGTGLLDPLLPTPSTTLPAGVTPNFELSLDDLGLSKDTRPLTERLKNTEMFKMLTLCSFYISELAPLLWAMSGNGMLARIDRTRHGGYAASRKSRQFQDNVTEYFFAPMKTRFRHDEAPYEILTMTKALVVDGLFICLREVEDYLIIVAKALMNQEASAPFIHAILDECRHAAGQMKASVYPSHAFPVSQHYSAEYVRNKLFTLFGDSYTELATPRKRSASIETQGSSESGNSNSAKKSKLECKICGQPFSVRSNLSRHKKLMHGNAPVFQCSFPGCGKICNRADNLQQHYNLKHGKRENTVDIALAA